MAAFVEPALSLRIVARRLGQLSIPRLCAVADPLQDALVMPELVYRFNRLVWWGHGPVILAPLLRPWPVPGGSSIDSEDTCDQYPFFDAFACGGSSALGRHLDRFRWPPRTDRCLLRSSRGGPDGTDRGRSE